MLWFYSHTIIFLDFLLRPISLSHFRMSVNWSGRKPESASGWKSSCEITTRQLEFARQLVPPTLLSDLFPAPLIDHRRFIEVAGWESRWISRVLGGANGIICRRGGGPWRRAGHNKLLRLHLNRCVFIVLGTQKERPDDSQLQLELSEEPTKSKH